MIKTNSMIFMKNNGLCPYFAEVQKEQRRNARIRDDEKRLDLEMNTDIPEAGPLMAKLKAHMRQRVERQTKNRWISLANKYANMVAYAGPAEGEAMREYLAGIRDKIETGRRKQKHAWQRSRERYMEEIC